MASSQIRYLFVHISRYFNFAIIRESLKVTYWRELFNKCYQLRTGVHSKTIAKVLYYYQRLYLQSNALAAHNNNIIATAYNTYMNHDINTTSSQRPLRYSSSFRVIVDFQYVF